MGWGFRNTLVIKKNKHIKNNTRAGHSTTSTRSTYHLHTRNQHHLTSKKKNPQRSRITILSSRITCNCQGLNQSSQAFNRCRNTSNYDEPYRTLHWLVTPPPLLTNIHYVIRSSADPFSSYVLTTHCPIQPFAQLIHLCFGLLCKLLFILQFTLPHSFECSFW